MEVELSNQGCFARLNAKAGGGASLFNLVMLSFSYAASLCITCTIITVGPLSAYHLGASKGVASFTIACFTIGSALSSLFSGSLFTRYGRRRGFLCGDMVIIMGLALCVVANYTKDEVMEFCGIFSIGLGVGMANFLRFAAVELVQPSFKEQSITFVLCGGILGAVVGILVASRSINLVPEQKFLGSFLLAFLFTVIKMLTMLQVDFTNLQKSSIAKEQEEEQKQELEQDATKRQETLTKRQEEASRLLSGVLRSGMFITAVALTTFTQTLMVIVMSTVALAMTLEFHENVIITLDVILLHSVAMFAPGFFTGKLIAKFGVVRMALCGCFIYLISMSLLFASRRTFFFFAGMTLIGVGWNLGYASGSVLLLSTYDSKSGIGPMVQSYHDFIMLLITGVFTMATGLVFGKWHWIGVLCVASAFVLFQAVVISYVFIKRRSLLAAKIQNVRESFSANIPATQAIEGSWKIASGELRALDASETPEMFVPAISDMRFSIDGGMFVDTKEYVPEFYTKMAAEVLNMIGNSNGNSEEGADNTQRETLQWDDFIRQTAADGSSSSPVHLSSMNHVQS